MEKIQQQVARAHRRLILQQFFGIAAWWLFAALLLAVIGLTVPKIWPLAVDRTIWMWSWLGGAAGGGLLGAILWTFFVRRSRMDAAIELDRRFGLKERVSSALSLQPDEISTEIGRALLSDAEQRVDRIDVRDNFPVKANWRALLPMAPAAVLFVLASGLIPDATRDDSANAAATSTALERARVEKSAKELQKRLAEVKKKAEEDGLKDADELFKELQKGLEEMTNKSEVDRSKALVKINDMAKELEKRKQDLGSPDKLREQMKGMKDMQQGPADKVAKAMKEGDFSKAMDELKKLQEKVKADDLTDEEKKELQQQLEQMQQKMQEMVEAHEQAKQDLEEQIKQKMAAGDMDGANKLQKQLDQLKQMNPAMKQMQQMAQKMGDCKKCMENGDMANAANELAQLADQLQDIQDQMEQLETLDEILDQIADAKDQMNCKQCNGEGCEACQGQFPGMNGGQMDGPPGFGLGEGQGQGDRPEEKDNTSFYESNVRGKVQQGEAVRTGSASGPNQTGKSVQEVKEQIDANLNNDSDPLIDVKLPKKEREHARQYFERFRE